jgi:DNA-binding CsgD family transcriptional regulator
VRRSSSGPLPRNLVFELLYSVEAEHEVTLPRGPLRVGGRAFSAVHPLASGGLIKVVVLYDATWASQGLAIGEKLRGVLRAYEFMRSPEVGETVKPAQVVRARRSAQLGIFTLDRDLRVLGAWLCPDPALAEMCAIIAPRSSALPDFLEVALREATAHWNWDDPAGTPTQVVVPMPNIVVRAIPMRESPAVGLVALVELLHVRYALASAQRDFHLSDREVQVLQLLFEGYRAIEIAGRLCLAESTVQDHIKHAISKTGSVNRVEMTARLLGWLRKEHETA